MSKIKLFSLGGLDENGKNIYCVEIDKDIFIFDCGLKYASGNMLGIDYLLRMDIMKIWERLMIYYQLFLI